MGRLIPGLSDAGVPEGRRAVELAHDCKGGYVRVFAFQTHGYESRKTALRRICDRLSKVVDHARHRDLQVVIENGADFASAEQVMEIVDRIDANEIGVCYDLKAALEAGDDPAKGVELIGSRLAVARLRDLDALGRPVPLGTGTLPCADFCGALAATNAWAIYTWDALWVDGLARGDQAGLDKAVERMFAWAGGAGGSAAA
jgi:sugar phosphate isomerase/epimerase